MRYIPSLISAFLLAGALSFWNISVSFAQDVDARVERLERDLRYLQREVYNEDTVGASSTPNRSSVIGNKAQQAALEVKLRELEDQMRDLQGMIEENRHSAEKATQRLDQLEQEWGQRFIELETRLPVTPPPTIGSQAPDEPKETSDPQKADAPEAPPKPAFESAREHYNHAFSALQREAYEEAESHFRSFVVTYPNDPLLGNVYYWLGETYYVREEYAKAANEFRKGYKAAQDGPKAPDNLLKLAFALEKQKKNAPACVVLKQLLEKYAEEKSGVLTKAKEASKRLACDA